MIVKEEKDKAVLLFVEAKIDKDHFDSIIEEILTKIKTIENDRTLIKKKYLLESTNKFHMEYVILIKAQYVDKLQGALKKKFHELRDKEIENFNTLRIVIWKADVNESWLERSEPGYNNEFFNRLVHADANLNSKLTRIERGGPNVLNFFPLSHIVKKLCSIILIVASNKARLKKATFTLNEIKESLEEELGYIHASLHGKILGGIIAEGLEMGLLDKVESSAYKVAEKYSGSSLNARIITHEWVKFRLYKELIKRLKPLKLELQKDIAEEFRTKPKPRRLEEWF